MTDIASIGYSVDTSSLQAGEDALDSFAAKNKKASDAIDNTNQILSAIQRQLIAFAANAGVAGQFLAALGPGGLVAAASLGAVNTAFSTLTNLASQAGEQASQLQAFATATGLTATQIQALQIAGARFGVGQEQINTSLTMFGFQLEAARQRTGTLYDAMLTINPAMADQLALIRNEPDALNLVSKALNTTTDSTKQLALARAAFGRRAGTVGPVFAAVDQQGGIDAAAKSMSDMMAHTDDETKQLAELKAAIDETGKVAKDTFSSIFDESVLRNQLEFNLNLLAASRAAKDFTMSDDMRMYLTVGSEGMPTPYQLPINQTPKQKATSSLGNKLNIANLTGNNTTSWASQIFTPQSATAPPQSDLDKMIGDLNKFKAGITAMGAGATIWDQAKVQIGAADIALQKHIITQEQYNQAVGSINQNAMLQVLSQRTSLLGADASATDVALQKQLMINKANQDGANITAQQATAIKETAVATQEWALAQNQAQAGIFDLNTATKAAGDEFQSWIDHGYLDPNNAVQMANAHEILAAKIQQVKQSAQDANPVMKAMNDLQFQLAQSFLSTADAAAALQAHQLFGSDWQAHMNDAVPNLARFNSELTQTRDYAADFANNFGQAMLQGKTATEALQSALTSLESSLIQMATKQLVNEAFGGLTGGSSGGGFNLLSLFGIGSSSSVLPGGSDLGAGGIGHARRGGIVGQTAFPKRYIHPAYFENAPRMANGGMITDGGVPIVAHPGERILNASETRDYNSKQGASNPQVTVNNYGADVQTTTDNKGNVELTVRAITRDEMASSRTNSIAKQKYNQSPTLKQRR